MSNMIKVKAGDLSGAALDWAVALAEGWPQPNMASPSTDWAAAGPIIKRENISLSPPTSVIHANGGNNPGWRPSGFWQACTWHQGVSGKRAFAWHETEPLIAAMRCFVRSKLGDEIEVPAELVEGGA